MCEKGIAYLKGDGRGPSAAIARCRGPAETKEISLYAIDSVDCAVVVIRDFAICEASLLDHAPNACVLPR